MNSFSTSLLLAASLTASALHAQQSQARTWVQSMTEKLSEDLRHLPNDKHYRWEELSYPAGDAEPIEVANEVFLGNAQEWRTVRSIEGEELHSGRSGDIAWDLRGDVIRTFSAKLGRLDDPRSGSDDQPARRDVNSALFGRLASLGYCLTGGLHLIAGYRLTPSEFSHDANGRWSMTAASDTMTLKYEGTFDLATSIGSVRSVRFVRSLVPQQLGVEIRFRNWVQDRSLGSRVAGRVTCHHADGKIYYDRILEPIEELDVGTLLSVTGVPDPSQEDPLLGTVPARTHYDETHEQTHYYLWQDERWTRFLLPEESTTQSAGSLRLFGWIMGVLALLQVLLTQRFQRAR